MSEYQVTFWRELPSMVVARDAVTTTKTSLPQRFQEGIDEAAMRLGDTDADAYLAGWTRAEWVSTAENPTEACELVVARLEEEWPPERVASYLDDLGPSAD